ncbi:MAG TPA: hypothetical protein EYO94_02650 [Acidobacteria bacterium]|nr:hypothetical protein [Acidobacteriota bacterium]HIN70257.1 hypothetical protein [Acidobacteriota bacterium]
MRLLQSRAHRWRSKNCNKPAIVFKVNRCDTCCCLPRPRRVYAL